MIIMKLSQKPFHLLLRKKFSMKMTIYDDDYDDDDGGYDGGDIVIWRRRLK